MDVFDHIETEARRHWASQTDAFAIDTDCLRQRLETRYTLVVAPGNSQCRLYLMPYPMRPGQHPMHLEQRFQDEWEEVGMLNSQLKVVCLDKRLHHLHSELEGSMGGTYFELDEQFQFVDGP